MPDLTGLRPALSRVLWIGGPPDSGKTSIAAALARRHGLPVYHFDRHEPAHFARATAELQPALWAAHPDRMTTEERWLGAPPEDMAAQTIASWSERCLMAFDDLTAMPGNGPLIAEGPGFFPELVAPVLTDPRKAVWLIPDEAFKRRSALARNKPGNRHETSDPARATANLIARDLLMGTHIRRQCAVRDLTHITVTGDEGIDAVMSRVEERFSRWLLTPSGTGKHHDMS